MPEHGGEEVDEPGVIQLARPGDEVAVTFGRPAADVAGTDIVRRIGQHHAGAPLAQQRRVGGGSKCIAAEDPVIAKLPEIPRSGDHRAGIDRHRDILGPGLANDLESEQPVDLGE